MDNNLPTSASFLVTERCNLNCKYCVTGDTKILTDKFEKIDIKNIKVGDKILGFDEYAEGKKHRKVKPTKVLQIFEREDSIIKITLENGLILKVTKGHPLLANRGNSKFAWRPAGKFKIGQKIQIFPDILINQANIEDRNYKLGYLIGIILGDANLKYYKDNNGYDAYRFRLAVKDKEIIDRIKNILNDLKISFTERDFLISKKDYIYKNAIFSSKSETYNKINNIINENFNKNKTYNYYCGFLAGIYDAEGHICKKSNTIRICNSDLNILSEIKNGLSILNINYVEEKNKNFINKQTYNIRILNGRKNFESLKFILNVVPAVKRKGFENFYNKCLLISSKIVNIEELNKEKVYNLETETKTYIANNFAVHNCFEKDKHNNKDMSIDVIHKSLDYLSDNAKLVSNGDGFHAMIFGGEPLLVPHLVEEICEYGYYLQEKKDIKFTATVITNGTQMNDKIFWLLNEYKNKIKLTCQLSIDGDKESQNKYRITKDGKGSFELIEKNIERFKLIYKNNMNLLSIHGCINKETLPRLFNNYRFFRENWGIYNLWFMPIHEEDWDEDDVIIYRQQLNMVADYLLKKSKENKNLSEIRLYTPINKCLVPYKKHSRLCGAGKNFVSITANGDIYPCHFFYFNDYNNDMKIGDIWNGIDENSKQRKEFLTYSIDKITCPSDCEHVNCYRCMGSNWLKNGNPIEQIRGYYCEISKVDKEVTDRMKKEILNLDFIDLNDKKQMSFEKSWVEKGKQYEKYINQIGEEVIFERELNDKEKEFVADYYEKNAIDILARGIKLILQKVNNLEKQNYELLKLLNKE